MFAFAAQPIRFVAMGGLRTASLLNGVIMTANLSLQIYTRPPQSETRERCTEAATLTKVVATVEWVVHVVAVIINLRNIRVVGNSAFRGHWLLSLSWKCLTLVPTASRHRSRVASGVQSPIQTCEPTSRPVNSLGWVANNVAIMGCRPSVSFSTSAEVRLSPTRLRIKFWVRVPV